MPGNSTQNDSPPSGDVKRQWGKYSVMSAPHISRRAASIARRAGSQARSFSNSQLQAGCSSSGVPSRVNPGPELTRRWCVRKRGSSRYVIPRNFSGRANCYHRCLGVEGRQRRRRRALYHKSTIVSSTTSVVRVCAAISATRWRVALSIQRPVGLWKSGISRPAAVRFAQWLPPVRRSPSRAAAGRRRPADRRRPEWR